MKIKLGIISILLVFIVLIGLILWGMLVSNVEQPKYEVISSSGHHIEIRKYAPMLVAEVVVQGERTVAINEGFSLLADYIFGNNTVSSTIPMTAPVIQQKNQKIPMTAPVMQQENGTQWIIRFVMPSRYISLNMLPKPNNEKIILREILSKKFAVIRFSGLHTSDNIKNHESILHTYVLENNIESTSPFVYAFYNPPWTLPFLRRNEVMIEVQ